MKIRTGFVSNSSSSSFVVVAPVNYDWTTGLTDDEIQIFKESFRPIKRTILGKDVYVYEGHSCDENDVDYSDTFNEIYGHDENFWEKSSELWDKFSTLFKKDECLVHWMEN